MRWIAAGVALAGACFASATGRLTGVTAQKIGQGVEVTIEGENLAKPKTIVVNGGRSYILEFDANLGGKAKNLAVKHAGLESVRYGWYKARPPKVRVHFRVSPSSKPVLHQEGSDWTVRLNLPKEATAPKAEKFPDKVPPLKAVAPAKSPLLASNQNSQETFALLSQNQTPTVSLEFVNTEVVQILKALALQAGVNIVTAPEVSGTLTVSLKRVSVQHALDYITTLAGLRYANVSNTFIVTSSNRFTDTMRQIAGRSDLSHETRVVSLASGEGVQIKAALLKAIPQNTLTGSYEIVLPSEQIKLETKGSTAPPTGEKAGEKGAANELVQTEVGTSTGTGTSAKKDAYLMLIGPRQRLDEVEALILELDKKIVSAAKIGLSPDIETRVVPTYSRQVSKIRESLSELLKSDPRHDRFHVSDSMSSEDGVSLLMITGPKDSLDYLVTFAQSLDRGIASVAGIRVPVNAEEAQRRYQLVDLKNAEPLQAAHHLQALIPGLRASLLPQPVDPYTYGPEDPVNQIRVKQPPRGENMLGSSAEQKVQQASSQGEGGQAQGAAGAMSSSATGANLSKPLGTEPMKLLLFGTASQIAEAKELLAQIDIAPETVAVEMRVMQLSKEDALRIGIDWSLLTGGTVQSLRVNQNPGVSAGNAGSVSGSLGLDGGGTLGILGALDKIDDQNKILARPNILANSGRPTQIFVGDEVRYVESIQSSSNGTTVTSKSINTGVTLTVTPRVGADGNITVELMPELSVLTGFTTPVEGVQLPQTSVRRAQSIVTMKDGETIAIGGLIQEQDRLNYSGIPILKDLPIIGQLFGRTSKSKVRSEVVFFLTVRRVNPETRGKAASPRESEKINPNEMREP